MKIRVFTDGACSSNPGPGGWAAIFNLRKSTRTISGYEIETTNNRMELLAVVKAVQKAKEKGIREIEINSDSAYVVNGIKKDWITNWKMNNWKTVKKEDVKNKDLWQCLDKLLHDESVKVSFVKIKGHAGNIFNELADKEAVRQTQIAKDKINA